MKPLLTPDALGLLDTVDAVAHDHGVAAQLDQLVASTTVALSPDELDRLSAASAPLG